MSKKVSNLSIRDRHEAAMELADKGATLLRSGKEQNARAIFRKAFAIEREVALSLDRDPKNEPSRSTLFKSAASLGIYAGDWEGAERMVLEGLLGTPSSEVADELRELFDTITFKRHLSLKGIELNYNEMVMTLVGKEVGPGYVKSDELISRVQVVSDIATREIERLYKKPFRAQGKKAKVIQMHGTYMGLAATGSYKLVLKIGKIKEPEIFSTSRTDMNVEVKVIDNIVRRLVLVQNEEYDALRKEYPSSEKQYYNHFLISSKNLAPDGERISSVSFTQMVDEKQKDMTMRITKNEIQMAPYDAKQELEPTTGESDLVEAVGILDLGQISKHIIKVLDEKKKLHPFLVDEGIIAGIIKTNVGDRVRVVGRRGRSAKGKPEVRFADIKALEE